MESPKQQIISNLQKAIEDLTGLEVTPRLEHPMEEKHGDYSSNIAMTIFSSSKFKTPMELAQEVVKILNTKYLILNTIEEVKVAPPGFINFWLSKDYLTSLMTNIIRAKEKYGVSKRLENKKIMVEFTDPNPFKEFHIGHLYSNIVGESICRLLEANGAIVKRANYQGDVGMHVAKALYGLLPNSKLEERPLIDRVKLLGEAYAFGARMFEEDESAKKAIIKINKQVYEKDPTVISLYKKGRSWSLEYFETIYKRLDTHFDYYYFESEVGKTGLDLVRKHKEKGVFEESKGAIIFPGEKYKLHNRVFINSEGFPTYEAKELGLAPTKYKDFKYDLSIIVTGNEIIEYFKVLLVALKEIYPNLAVKTEHVSHGIVRLPKGKMSSRTGNIVTAEWLLDEAKSRIKNTYHMDEETAEKVAVGAVKYALLKNSIGRDIAFNFEESISLEGNSGPYLQYTYARTQSVLAKANRKNVIPNLFRDLDSDLRQNDNGFEPEEISLLRILYRFPEVVEEAGEKFSPNLLCNYLFDLCQKFNLFYQKVPILRPVRDSSVASLPQNDKRRFRLVLTMAVGQIVKNGLNMLGIQAPERM